MEQERTKLNTLKALSAEEEAEKQRLLGEVSLIQSAVLFIGQQLAITISLELSFVFRYHMFSIFAVRFFRAGLAPISRN